MSLTMTGSYDRAGLISRTQAEPAWVHFGAGNLFRAFVALGADRAIDAGAMDRGIIASASRDTVEWAYLSTDCLCPCVTLGADGSMDVRVIGSVVSALVADDDFERLRAVFEQPSLQLASFTITEKGYSGTLMGVVARLMLARYRACGQPIALVSMDNCSRNGDVLKAAVINAAQGMGDEGFMDYLGDPSLVSFPWTMIDKITPAPNPDVADMLRERGIPGMEIHTTARGAKIANFVNAEQPGYLVIEDDFPNGRPDFGACGFLMTDRDTVSKAERMKVCTCLNPLHTALAVFGCLLGYERISAEMKDQDLVRLIERLGYIEGLPVSVDPGIIEPKEFIDQVLRQRFPNLFVPDAPQRIATDTSQKLAIRFGETLKAHVVKGDAQELAALPLVLAGWLRYLTGIDDSGERFERSPDPMLLQLQPIADHLAELRSGFDQRIIEPLLRDARVFGMDLFEAGIAERVTDDLRRMLMGPGAVRNILTTI